MVRFGKFEDSKYKLQHTIMNTRNLDLEQSKYCKLTLASALCKLQKQIKVKNLRLCYIND
jgi:DNA/RNA endonuclease YhcR with UshA esterase domain